LKKRGGGLVFKVIPLEKGFPSRKKGREGCYRLFVSTYSLSVKVRQGEGKRADPRKYGLVANQIMGHNKTLQTARTPREG